jgi:myo-inositol-1(or 4)-monophosphatase
LRQQHSDGGALAGGVPMQAEQVRVALGELRRAALAAGALALPYFRRGAATSARIATKAGGSPVTEADHLVDRFLAERLRASFPQAGWLSEESLDGPERLTRPTVLIVDPIDGTRGFAQGDSRWTICVALVIDGRPVAGVVHAPALGETYAAGHGVGAFLNEFRLQPQPRTAEAALRVAGPKLLVEAMQAQGLPLQREAAGPSLAYRFAQMAAGRIDVGMAAVNSHDWDLAAVDIVVHQAGGLLSGLDSNTLIYNRPFPRHGILIAARADLHGRLIEAMASPGRPVALALSDRPGT